MYIVTFCQNEKSCEPSVFSDKLAAYKRWAEALINIALVSGVVDDLYYPSLNAIKDFTDCLELKTFIDNIFREKENVYAVEYGYAFCFADGSRIVIQIFEVDLDSEGENHE